MPPEYHAYETDSILGALFSLKWKPPSENSIDFKLVLRFPPDPRKPNEPDYHAKPVFGLHICTGNTDRRGESSYEPFDEMYLDDDEWEKYVVDRQ